MAARGRLRRPDPRLSEHAAYALGARVHPLGLSRLPLGAFLVCFARCREVNTVQCALTVTVNRIDSARLDSTVFLAKYSTVQYPYGYIDRRFICIVNWIRLLDQISE